MRDCFHAKLRDIFQNPHTIFVFSTRFLQPPIIYYCQDLTKKRRFFPKIMKKINAIIQGLSPHSRRLFFIPCTMQYSTGKCLRGQTSIENFTRGQTPTKLFIPTDAGRLFVHVQTGTDPKAHN